MAATKVPAEQISTFPKCKVVRTSDTSIGNGVWTAVPFDAEAWDTNTMHDNATNNTRITIPTGQGGHYLLQGHVQFASNVNGGRGVKFVKNNTTATSSDGGGTFAKADQTYESRLGISTTLSLNAGDYVDMRVYQNTGVALNVQANAGEYELGTWFSVTKLP